MRLLYQTQPYLGNLWKCFFPIALIQGFVLRSTDIRAAFLQDKCLDREVFLDLLKDVRKDRMLWRLRRPLFGLNNSSSKLWLKVNEFYSNIGQQRLEGYEAFFYKYGRNKKFEGIVSTNVVDFNLAVNPKFINILIKFVRKALDV